MSESQVTRRQVLQSLALAGTLIGTASCFRFAQPLLDNNPTLNTPNALKIFWKAGINEGPLASINALSQLPYAQISNYLEINRKDSITILYPGAGSHLAMLELGIRLQRMNPNLRLVKFIYTEVQEDAVANFVDAVSELGDRNLRIVGKRSKRYEDTPTSREVTLEIGAFGRQIEVMYAISRSHDPEDHAYFKQKYAVDADIVVFHDSFFVHPDIVHAFLYVLNPSILDRKKILVFDDFMGGNDTIKEYRRMMGRPDVDDDRYDILPGVHSLITADWGCRRFGGVITYFPDVDALRRIYADPVKKREFEKEVGKRSVG